MKTQSRVEENHKVEVPDLITQNSDIFVTPTQPLGRTNLVEHKIPTGNATPIKQPLRRMSPAHREIVDKEVQKMLHEGIIQESCSSWSSPVVLVRKKGSDQLRFCVDFRALNEVTEKDAYSLANIQDCLDALKGALFFATMDLASGFWQAGLAPQDHAKTAFPTRFGHFEFLVMPLASRMGPSTFQRLMEQVLRGLQWQTALVYLDDVVVFGRSFTETKERLQVVFNRFRDAGLKLKPSKCQFFQSEVLYLGHIIGRDGIACDHEKIEAVKYWPTPQTVKDVRSFLGLAGYYRRFIPEFSQIAAPLTTLIKKNQYFLWTPACQKL